MEAAPPPASCSDSEIDYLLGITSQTFLFLIISHLFHLVLKHLGQPIAISNMLAGVVMGKSIISTVPKISSVLYPGSSMDYLSSTAAIGRMFFMFLVGLEMDLGSLRRTARRASYIAGAGAAVCLVVGGSISPLMIRQTNMTSSKAPFVLTLLLVFTDTASPILIRMVTELKLSTSDFGRLAIAAALVNDIACLVLVALFTPNAEEGSFSPGRMIGMGIGAAAVIGGAAYLSRPGVRWLNRRNRQRKHIKSTEIVSLLLFVIGISSLTEMMGYNSMMTSLVLGMAFPREGSTTRTLVNKLTYPVHNVLLPAYIGYIGAQTNATVMNSMDVVVAVGLLVALSAAAKVGGTVLVARHIGLPISDAVVLGLLLNVKGHVDLIILGMSQDHRILGVAAFNVLLVNVVICTLMAGPAVAVLVRRDRRTIRYTTAGLEWQPPEAELRVLACIHTPRDAPAVLNLVEILNGTDQTPLSAHVMHLVELPNKTSMVLYHQQEEIEDGDDDEYGGDNARQVNVAVDAFMVETGIRVRQATAVSAFSSMHDDICKRAEDIRASVILVPFHKFQRVDGKMVGTKDAIRSINVKVLRHCSCSTVGILVDRGLGGVSTQTTSSSSSAGGGGGGGGGGQQLQQQQVQPTNHRIVVLFFGGPDDREAVAFGGRLAMHPGVTLTVMRFLPPDSKREHEEGITIAASKDEEVLMAISSKPEREGDADDAFLSNFYNKLVVSGMVTYEEKFVESGRETVAVINALEGLYSLFLVGRGRRGLSALTTRLREREECPELGALGDMLASSESRITASVLVLQQHSRSKDDNNGGEDFVPL